MRSPFLSLASSTNSLGRVILLPLSIFCTSLPVAIGYMVALLRFKRFLIFWGKADLRGYLGESRLVELAQEA